MWEVRVELNNKEKMPGELLLDEEDLLGFHVFMAEVELLLANTKGKAPMPKDFTIALVEILQKLEVSMDHTSVKILKSCQNRCEQVLNSILLKGACPEVSHVLTKLGDGWMKDYGIP